MVAAASLKISFLWGRQEEQSDSGLVRCEVTLFLHKSHPQSICRALFLTDSEAAQLQQHKCKGDSLPETVRPLLGERVCVARAHGLEGGLFGEFVD